MFFCKFSHKIEYSPDYSITVHSITLYNIDLYCLTQTDDAVLLPAAVADWRHAIGWFQTLGKFDYIISGWE